MMGDVWIPDPARRVKLRASGTDNMGDVSDEMSTARFSLPTELVNGIHKPVAVWCLVGFRLKITGGTGDATLELKLDHRDRSQVFDFLLRRWTNVGNDASSKKYVNHRVDAVADLFALYAFDDGDELVFVWTNPDPAVMAWALEVTLAPVKLAGV